MDPLFIEKVRRSSLQNYVLPGMISSLLDCKLRVFEMTRTQEEHVTPHSHRFDFYCYVVNGTVENTIYRPSVLDRHDMYEAQSLVYGGAAGEYVKGEARQQRYSIGPTRYHAGHWYEMTYDQIHSIRFSKGAVVLFFEGPEVTKTTQILQPVVAGSVCPTFRVADWMFQPISEVPR